MVNSFVLSGIAFPLLMFAHITAIAVPGESGAASADFLPKKLAVLGLALPWPRRRLKHQALALEAHLAHLVGAHACRIGAGVDAGDQRGAVERVGAAVGVVFARGLAGRQVGARAAQDAEHA